MTISANCGDKPVDPNRGSQTGSDVNNSSKEELTTEYWVNVNHQTGDVGNDRK